MRALGSRTWGIGIVLEATALLPMPVLLAVLMLAPSFKALATPDDRPAAGATLAGLAERRAARNQTDEPAGNADADANTAGAAGSNPALPSGVTVHRDLAYGPEPEQRIDVFLPARAEAAPVVFMVHGGGWMFGDKANAAVVGNKAARWLPRGIAFVSVNYRLLPRADPLAQAGDVAKALAFAQSQARSWGADPARFALMGHSSGSHLVALLAADPGIARRQGAAPWLGTIALDSAALDVVRLMEEPHARFYDRVFRGDAADWREVSPLHRLAGRVGPLLLVCSSRRGDSCPQARAFAAKAETLGGRATVVPVAISHAEVNQRLGLAGDYTDSVESFMRSIGLP